MIGKKYFLRGLRSSIFNVVTNSAQSSSKAECGRRGGNYFLFGSDCCPNRSENNLNHPESFLLEREDILERWEHFPGLLEDNLKVCDNLLHLPNKYLKDKENDRRDSEMFLNDSETFLSLSETFLSLSETFLRQ